jgi:Zn-dependent membrane protease YugP
MIFMIPAFLLMVIAQAYVNGAYRKWSQVMANARLTGAQAAERLISAGGLDVGVDGIRGKLTDNYDPRRKTLFLSEGVYNSSSVAALAIAAHELGHAVMHGGMNMFFIREHTLFPAGKFEHQANTFAAELLITDELLHKYIGYTISEIASIENIHPTLFKYKKLK